MSRRKTHEEFVDELFGKYGDEYIALSNYVDSNTKITIKHNKCGHTWNPYPLNILRKSGCPECKKSKLRDCFKLDFDNVIKTFEDEGYKILSTESDYINAHSELEYVCPEGHKDKMDLNHFKSQGNRCPICSRILQTENQRKDIDEVMKAIESVGCEFISFPDGEYKNTQSKVTVLCENGHITTKSFMSISKGHGCPHCKNPSKSEVKIAEILKRENVEFIQQYKIPECKNKRELPFDFAIFKNGQLLLLLEFDGRQHFIPVQKFGGEEGFIKTQENDHIKNVFCENNNIPLERLNYKQSNILERVLLQVLDKYF